MLNATKNRKKNNKITRPIKITFETAEFILSSITVLAAMIYAYQIALSMTTVRQEIKDNRNNLDPITDYQKITLCLYNALRGFCGIAGAVMLNTNFAINGVAPKLLNQIQNYFYRSAARSTKDGIISFIKITSIAHMLYAIVFRLFDLGISADPNNPRNAALHWTWGIGSMVSLMVVDIFTLKSFLKKYFLNETPFLEIILNNQIHLIHNPSFGGRTAIQDDVKAIIDFSEADQRTIRKLIAQGHYKPVESKNGVTDNHYGWQSLAVRSSMMLTFTSISFLTGWANRVIDYGDNPSMPLLCAKYLLYALSDINSLYIVGVPLLKDPIIKGINKYIVNPLIGKNQHNNSKGKTIAAIGTTLVSLSLSLFFYGGYRLLYDKLYPMNFLYIDNPISNSTMIGNGTALPQYGPIGETINEQILANFSLGLGIMFEGTTFFNLFDTLLNATDWVNTSSRKKAWLFQSIFITITSLLAFYIIPISNPYARTAASIAAAACYAIAAKLEYNGHQQEKKRRIEKNKIDYIDQLNEEINGKTINEDHENPDNQARATTKTSNGKLYQSLSNINNNKPIIIDDKVGGASNFGSKYSLNQQFNDILSGLNTQTIELDNLNAPKKPIYIKKDGSSGTLNLSNSIDINANRNDIAAASNA